MLQCQMKRDCTAKVTHIGSKGYIYCADHAKHRHGYENTRKMRAWEVNLLDSGKPLPSYKPIRKPAEL